MKKEKQVLKKKKKKKNTQPKTLAFSIKKRKIKIPNLRAFIDKKNNSV